MSASAHNSLSHTHTQATRDDDAGGEHLTSSTSSTTQPSRASSAQVHIRARWRPIDITVASVIAVASGLVFWIFDMVEIAPAGFLDGLVPGLSGLISGFWYFAGVLAMLIVRKPGAAMYAETIGGLLELALGNQWGFSGSLLAGLVQGIFTEIVFALLHYRVWNVWSATISGLITGLGGAAYSFVVLQAGLNTTGAYVVTNIIANCISGAVISGALMWWLFIAIARTGALSRFASGRLVFNTAKQ